MLNETERGEAAAVQRRYGQQVAAIRADDHLTDRGKRSAIARATLSARAGMRALRETSDARDAQERADLQYTLFGLGTPSVGTDILAMRDARDRAAAITRPGDAAKMLDAAERTGDTSLARAVFERCWNQSGQHDLGGHWTTLAGAYVERHPEIEAAASTLAALTSASSHDKLRDNLSTHVPVPAEVSFGSIEALAAEREDDSAA